MLLDEIKAPLWDITFSISDDLLESSIKTHGILLPLLLSEEKRIVDGVRRFGIAKKLGMKDVPVLICSGKMVQELFLIFLEVHRWTRSFNLVEKGRVLKQARLLFSKEKTISNVYPLLGFVSEHQAKDCESLCTLDFPVLQFIVQQALPLNVASRFLKIKSSDKIVSLLQPLSLNQNSLADVLDLLLELSRKESKTVATLLEEHLSHLPGAQKGELLRKRLKENRHPRYQQKLVTFEKGVQALVSSSSVKNIQINPAPYFEEDYVELKVRLHDQNDRKKLIELLQKKDWEEL